MIRFICEPEDKNRYPRVEFELGDEMILSDVIENFEKFIQSAGFYLPEGTKIDLVEVDR